MLLYLYKEKKLRKGEPQTKQKQRFLEVLSILGLDSGVPTATREMQSHSQGRSPQLPDNFDTQWGLELAIMLQGRERQVL